MPVSQVSGASVHTQLLYYPSIHLVTTSLHQSGGCCQTEIESSIYVSNDPFNDMVRPLPFGGLGLMAVVSLVSIKRGFS